MKKGTSIRKSLDHSKTVGDAVGMNLHLKRKQPVGKSGLPDLPRKLSQPRKTLGRSDFSLKYTHRYRKTTGVDVEEGESRFSLNHSKESEPFLVCLLRFLFSIFQSFKKNVKKPSPSP